MDLSKKLEFFMGTIPSNEAVNISKVKKIIGWKFRNEKKKKKKNFNDIV